MDELTRAQVTLSHYKRHQIETSKIVQESVVLSPDELDTDMLSPVVISTLPSWIVLDMYEIDDGRSSIMTYFIREASGDGEAFLQGMIQNNKKVLWVKWLN